LDLSSKISVAYLRGTETEQKRDEGREISEVKDEISSHQLNHSLVSFVQGSTGISELKDPNCPHSQLIPAPCDPIRAVHPHPERHNGK
jgi:hypothetical protein